jgi:hypothetical protein
MATESSVIIGSGLNPKKLQVPLNSVSHEAHLRGTDVVVINPEDSSAGRSGLVTQINVGTSAVQIPTIPLKYRRALSIRNNSSTAKVYIGFGPDVTTGAGFPLNPGEALPLEFNAAIPIWGISDANGGNADVRVLEVS